jgi:hypothetical protein
MQWASLLLQARSRELLRKAAKYYAVRMTEAEWRELGRRPSTGRPASARSASASKAAQRASGTAREAVRPRRASAAPYARRPHARARGGMRRAAGRLLERTATGRVWLIRARARWPRESFLAAEGKKLLDGPLPSGPRGSPRSGRFNRAVGCRRTAARKETC